MRPGHRGPARRGLAPPLPAPREDGADRNAAALSGRPDRVHATVELEQLCEQRVVDVEVVTRGEADDGSRHQEVQWTAVPLQDPPNWQEAFAKSEDARSERIVV